MKIDHRHNGEDKYSLFWTQAKWADKFENQAMQNVPSSAFGVSVLYSDAHQVDTTNQLQMITVERKSNLSYHVRSAWKKAHVLRAGGLPQTFDQSGLEEGAAYLSECVATLEEKGDDVQAQVRHTAATRPASFLRTPAHVHSFRLPYQRCHCRCPRARWRHH